MTDIVEWLRWVCVHGEQPDAIKAMEKAADEIDRLRGLLTAKTTPGYELLAGTIEKQEAEIERRLAERKVLVASHVEYEMFTAITSIVRLREENERLRQEIERLTAEVAMTNYRLDKQVERTAESADEINRLRAQLELANDATIHP